jgi:hypothetical protein
LPYFRYLEKQAKPSELETEKKHHRNLVRSVLQRQLQVQQKKKVYENQERDQKTNTIEKSRNFGMTSNMTHYLLAWLNSK